MAVPLLAPLLGVGLGTVIGAGLIREGVGPCIGWCVAASRLNVLFAPSCSSPEEPTRAMKEDPSPQSVFNHKSSLS